MYLIESAYKIAADKELPQSFAKLFVGSNDEETQQNLDNVKQYLITLCKKC
ncbi:DUF4355 domain-containing protein [Companilactobacillus paralimentarius]|nr:DUF4355 domain-containing protein [Companilactobacillus paralimentarius]